MVGELAAEISCSTTDYLPESEEATDELDLKEVYAALPDLIKTALNSLPVTIERLLSEIREKDDAAQEQSQLLSNDFLYLEDTSTFGTEYQRKDNKFSILTSREENLEIYNSIITKFAEQERLARENLLLANQIYDSVDRVIRDLDDEMSWQETEFITGRPHARPRQSQIDANNGDTLSSSHRLSATNNNGGPKTKVSRRNGRPHKREQLERDSASEKKKKFLGRNKLSKKASKSTGNLQKSLSEGDLYNSHHLPTVAEMPVDDNEPRYCVCQGVAHGKMIACDNEMCDIEWFHFGCVGITQQPKGKWFCPSCRLKFDNESSFYC